MLNLFYVLKNIYLLEKIVLIFIITNSVKLNLGIYYLVLEKYVAHTKYVVVICRYICVTWYVVVPGKQFILGFK